MKFIERNGLSIRTENHIQGRVKPCLCIGKDNYSTVIGYFRDDECVKHFWEAFDYIVNSNESPYILEIVNGGRL